MTEKLKNNIKTSAKMSPAPIQKKQLFEKASNDLKSVSSPDREEELCHSLDRKLFQLEEDLAYFNFAIKEIKDIIKFS